MKSRFTTTTAAVVTAFTTALAVPAGAPALLRPAAAGAPYSLSAHALLGPTQTDLYLTVASTGPALPDELGLVQVKVFAATGEHMRTETFHDVAAAGGTAQVTLKGLERKQVLEVKAHAKDQDQNNIEARAAVLRRPDLTVAASAPARVVRTHPFTLTANVTELVVSVFLVVRGELTVVKASLTGSILGNLLLVLGMSFLAGGLRHPEQSFSARAAAVHSTSMTLAVIGLLMPALFVLGSGQHDFVQREVVSATVAGILIALYAAALVFTLVTHEHLFRTPAATERPRWSSRLALVVLIAATALVAVESELLVGSIEAAVARLGISKFFIGLIVIPVAAAARPVWALRSWDRFRIPRPFARVWVGYGEPLSVPPDLDAAGEEAWRARLEAAIAGITTTVDRRARGDA